MLKALIIYFICVLALTFGAAWLTMLIHGTKLRSFCSVRLPRSQPHGPQKWAWWRVLGVRVYVLQVAAPSTGRRVWVYTRRGARYFDLVLDRTGQALKVENVDA